MLNNTKEKIKDIKLSKSNKSLLGHILNEHVLGIEEELKDPCMLNKDKASLRREAKQVASLKEKLGL